MRLRVLAGPARVAALFSLLAAPSGASDFVLVVNAKNPASAVSKQELKNLVLGRQKMWKEGGVIQLALPSEDSEAFHWLAEQVFGVPPKLLMTKIRQEVFKGELGKPQTCGDDAECLGRVRSTPSALSIVSTHAQTEGVKPLPLTN